MGRKGAGFDAEVTDRRLLERLERNRSGEPLTVQKKMLRAGVENVSRGVNKADAPTDT